jgi:plastocyanin
MKRYVIAAVLAAAVLSVSACGGYNAASPTGPSVAPAPPAVAPPAGTVVIDVVGINGAQSFSPNPSTVPAGQAVVWHNVDTVTHRVVFDDGEVDSGNIAPGAFSQPMLLVAPGLYHCSIHPVMVGSVNQPTGPQPANPGY